MSPAHSSRREFLGTSSVAAGAALLGGLSIARSAHAGSGSGSGDEVLKVGLIGCGGRGTGAATQALNADKNVKLIALGDAFADSLQSSLNILQKNPEIADKVAVTKETSFVGFDAYKQVIDSGVDVVLLCTPPHFRPMHLEYAVEKGKHIFCEKPVAVDAPGVRRVMEISQKAKEKKLALVSGLCWRYDHGVRETMKRVQDGDIGEIIAIQENYLAGGLWHRGRKPEWSEMEYQMRNWLYFTWLSGDHNVEQHIHSLDKASWAMGDEPPKSAFGLGGRQSRTDTNYGHIFDHHAVVYEYANGVKVFAYTRQQDNCSNGTEDYFLGTKGRAQILRHEIQDAKGNIVWKYKGKKGDMYQVEHNELFASIRSGEPINNGLYMSRSTMLAIMGRMATYTGQTLTWEQALNSKEDLSPAEYAWGDIKTPPVARPGATKFV